MDSPEISNRFDAEDIRKLREFNSLNFLRCPTRRF